MLHVEWHLNEIKESNCPSFLIFGYKELIYEQKYLKSNINYDKSLIPRFWEWKELLDKQYQNPTNEWEKLNIMVDNIPINFLYNRRSGELKNFLFTR
jgi:hypothetical protein